MSETIKTTYDTLTTNHHRNTDGGRPALYYLEKWKRRHGLAPSYSKGKLEKFRHISKYQTISPYQVVRDEMPRVIENEYDYYRWNIGPLLCVYCHCELTSKTKTQEHVIPRYRGGSRLGRDNIEPACVECNSSKGCLSLLMFLLRRSINKGSP